TKPPFGCPFRLHLSTAGYLKIRLRPLVKFQPVSVVSFHPASTGKPIEDKKQISFADTDARIMGKIR
ncbi:MAG: hypothetical protein PHW53_05100, partial [Patescibacteria group bacterium]|nr:hypothetical protein [Patescibacteria group bacterium]